MTRQDKLRDAIKRPLPLPYNPLYRFYKGGALVRAFRGISGRPDDWWSEDWVGSCTIAGNSGPDGSEQGLSTVEVKGVSPVTLKSLVEAVIVKNRGVHAPGELANFIYQFAYPQLDYFVVFTDGV